MTLLHSRALETCTLPLKVGREQEARHQFSFGSLVSTVYAGGKEHYFGLIQMLG